MQIRSLTLREIHLKLLAPFETSMDRVTERRILLAELNLDSSAGWGECTAGESPFYSPEDTETSWHIITTYLWPMLKGKHIQSAGDVWPLLEHVRGHTMAKATLETAAWDAEAKLDRKSTRLNSSHQIISYAVFCLKKKKKICIQDHREHAQEWLESLDFGQTYICVLDFSEI